MINRRSFVRLLSLSIPAFAVAREARAFGLRLYFVRHAETLANATGKYNSQTIDRLSARGEQQVARLTRELLGMSLDTICVSPMRRAVDTIRPYLEESKLVANVWPELAECCHQKVRTAEPSPHLPRGAEIAPVGEARRLMRIDAADRYTYEPANYADGIALIRLAVQRINREFGASNRSEMLLGWEPRGRFAIANAEISRLNQVEDGTFELIQLNGRVSAFKFPTAPAR